MKTNSTLGKLLSRESVPCAALGGGIGEIAVDWTRGALVKCSMDHEDTATRNATLRPILWAWYAFIALIAGTYLLRPFYDPDFYWHLKTGEWIWQHGTLPAADPFGTPPLPEPTQYTRFTLTSYWLAQVLLYGFYALGGMTGIVIYRWLLALLTAFVFARWVAVRNGRVAGVLALGCLLLLEFYFPERPQFLSFICFAILLVMVFTFFEQRRHWPWWHLFVPLCLLMVFWANVHGGYVIGLSVLLFCAVTEGSKFLHRSMSPLSRRNYCIFLVSATAAAFASLLHPHPMTGLMSLPDMLNSDTALSQTNLEYLSLWRYFGVDQDYMIIFYLLSMALTLWAVLASRQRSNITWLGILLVTAAMGYQHIRLMPFFLVAATLFMARYVSSPSASSRTIAIVYAFLAVTSVHCLRDEFPRVVEGIRSQWVPETEFPVQAANVIASRKLTGHVFTTWYWSGYLVWRLGPEQKIFCDGRWIDPGRHREYVLAIGVDINDYYWKVLFRKYDIRVAVLPLLEETGAPFLLTRVMMGDPEWSVVYAGRNEVIFVKKTMD